MADDRILYIEDNLRNRVLVKRVLEIEGYQVFEAEDGTEGFKKGTSETYDLILMDINLPDMDGYQVTKKLRDENVVIPIVALTANAMMGDREKALAAGCDGYISKPVDIDKLPEQVAEYIKLGKEKVAAKPAEKVSQPESRASKAPEESKVKVAAKPASTPEKPVSTPEKDTTPKIEKPELVKTASAAPQEKKTEVSVPAKAEDKEDKAEPKEEKKEPETPKASDTNEKISEPEKKSSTDENKPEEKVNSSETNNVDPLTDTGLVL